MTFDARAFALAGLASTLIVTPAVAERAQAAFDIPAQPLAGALTQFARQAGREVLFDPALVADKRAGSLKGRYEIERALTQLLGGSGLKAQVAGRALVITPAVAPTSASAETAAASEALAPVQEAATVDEVVVVGSKIVGADPVGASPVTVLGQEQLEAQGVASAGELVGRLAQSGAQAFNSGVQGPNNARGDVASANLRGLGSGNTLVLLDGRRMVMHPTSQQENGAIPVQIVNLNAIPTSALRRVEVLRDGASALYGSDATAGVINFVIDRHYEGAQVTGRYGFSEGTNFAEDSVTFKVGTRLNGDRTHVAVFGEVFHNTDMPATDRSYAATDDLSDRVDSAYAGYFNRTQSQSPWATGRVSTPITGLGAVFTTFFVQPCALSGSRANLSPAGVCLNGGSATLPSALRTDEGRARTMIPRTSRGSVMATLAHDLTSDVSLFGDLLYYQASAWAGRGGSTLLNDATLVVSRDNPFNPFGSGPGRLAGYTGPAQDVTLVGYNILDVGDRNFDVDNQQYRGVLGLKGRVGDWRWETSGVWSRARTTDTEHNRVSNTALQAALSSSNPNTAYNPFNGGDLGAPRVGDSSWNPASVTDPLRIDVTRRSVTKLGLLTAELSNPTAFALFGRDIGVAAGAEWRYESYDDYRDPRVNGSVAYVTPSGGRTSDVVGTSQTLDTHGDRNVVSAYAELRAGIVRPEDGVPLVKSFELQGAARLERYSDTGDAVLKPKIAVNWAVTDALKLRAAYSEAFRAPNLEQINAAPATRVQQNQTDLYRCALAQGATTIAAINRSACAGFRADVSEVRSGNDQLKAEDSKTLTAGVVLTPLKNLTVTVDRWRIEQTGLVGILSTQDQINLDAIQRLERGASNPLVTRNAANQVTSVQAIFQNLNTRTVEATDIAVTYLWPTERWGDFRLNADLSVFDKFYQAPSPEAAALVAAGLSTASGGSQIRLNGNPRTRASATALWTSGPWLASLSTVSLSGLYDTSALNYPVGSWTTVNTAVRYAVEAGPLSGTSFRVGVNNLEDKAPPLANQLFGFYSSLHNPRGRFWFVEISKAF
ncbi:TonB-dependent receptor [Brevundimonas sp. SORGH_AS_0993]|uniref:TonB-dependent receptor n=1 Tax=Brevundimonas sp. SORGH_AS_0993 TaxID=3041794 RepID=UPI00277F17D9|nr:TonB-dependent receptor [Brevundimonas sp. SORGH_AS_0993]MDQ1155152.1 iron complex outermembrane receptor protein [Brevundimonas sp. SORGH_AS_0993]